MKKLQNNFTTPEQSKMLLELGIPADSADCIYVRLSKKDKFSRKFRENVVSENPYEYFDFYYPCWSVGRLFEIVCVCTESWAVYGLKIANLAAYYRDAENVCDICIGEIERLIKIKAFDFSKLEE